MPRHKAHKEDTRPAEVKQLEKALLRRGWSSREKIRRELYSDDRSIDKAQGALAIKDVGPRRKVILDLMVMAPDSEWVNYFPMIPLADGTPVEDITQDATTAPEKPQD